MWFMAAKHLGLLCAKIFTPSSWTVQVFQKLPGAPHTVAGWSGAYCPQGADLHMPLYKYLFYNQNNLVLVPQQKDKKNQETNRVQFLCTSLSPVQMRNDDHYIFMPASHWPHVETNPKQEMNALQQPLWSRPSLITCFQDLISMFLKGLLKCLGMMLFGIII